MFITLGYYIYIDFFINFSPLNLPPDAVCRGRGIFLRKKICGLAAIPVKIERLNALRSHSAGGG
jgi:hypothetical protein